jgi:hypothetical protein
MAKQIFIVKGWIGDKSKPLGRIALDPKDTPSEKRKVRDQLKEKWGKEYEFEISNPITIYLLP